ncbi:type IV secretory system conjugative DNA transfer family protein [Candidatus Uhrbacteria bacterium]|nr:type IV secretory system conjugative DNA transfer family protein [Candidatus Uhrbacteria bacterium]
MIPLLQISINTGSTSPGVLAGSNLGAIIAITVSIVVAILAIIISIFVYRKFHLREHRRAGGNLARTILRIRLPRFASSTETGSDQLSAVQEDIAVAETVFAALGGLTAQKGMKAWLHGRTDEISFEMVSNEGVIYFYVAVPLILKDLTTQQIHGQFPDADIDEVEDYNIFSPTGVVLGSYMTLKRENLFPIKTYRQLESDPLNALLNALAKVSQDEGAAIQFVVRSAPAQWRSAGLEFVKHMHEGMTAKEALGGGKKRKQAGVGDLVTGKSADSGPEQVRKLGQREEEMVKNIEEKSSKAGLDVNIRIVASAGNVGAAQAVLSNLINSFAQYNVYEFGNSFEKDMPKNAKKLTHDFIYRNFSEKHKMVLSTEEMASVWHPPLPGTETTNIDWLGARKSGAPANIAKEGQLLGFNEYRGNKVDIRIKVKDRQRHMYIIGKSGSGKTVFLGNMISQDIQNGSGVCVVDPHGDLIEEMLGIIPKERVNDVIVFSPADRDMPMGLNMLEVPSPEMMDLVVGDMISVFYKLFPPEMIGPMFEHTMRNVMMTLMSDPENPGTIAEVPRMITDPEFQKQWIAKVTDPVVRAYWEQEVANTSDFHKSEMFGYLTSKVGRFVEDSTMRNIIGQGKSGFNFRDVMDEEKILLVDLAKGKIGEVNMQLLGLIVVSKLQMAAMSRADIPEELRKDFYLYIDEFQNFVTPSIATILAEARKYKLCLVMAHQYMSQVVDKGDTDIKDAILGNVGSMFVSRIGPEDTETFRPIYEPTFSTNDLINSDAFTWYVKMIVDNNQVAPFTMKGNPPIKTDPEWAKKVRQLSRVTYARKRESVEKEIARRAGLGEFAPKPKAPEPPAGAPPAPAPAPAPAAAQPPAPAPTTASPTGSATNPEPPARSLPPAPRKRIRERRDRTRATSPTAVSSSPTAPPTSSPAQTPPPPPQE